MRRLFVLLVLSSVGAALAAGTLSAEIVERVVAKVNGQIITLSDFQSRQIAAAQAARVDPANVGQFLRQNNARILQEAIDDLLIMQRAEEAGIKAPPQWIDEAINGIKKDNNLTTEEQFEEALQHEGMTLGELRQNIERGILKRYVLERDIKGRVEVSDSELRAEYDKLKTAQFTKPPTVSLQEILIKEADGGLGRAREVVVKARGGEDFAALAKAHSSAASKANGGEIGEVARTDMSPDLAKLTDSLAVGGISDPMPVEGGFRILKVTAKTEGSTTPFEAAKEKIRDQLMGSRFEKEYDTYMTDLRKNAQVELRVREVPLRLTGPIPEGSLLEALDPGIGPGSLMGGAPGGGSTGTGATGASPTATPRPSTAPAGVGDDEIQTTPQAAPQRVAPPAAPAPATPAAPATPPPAAPGETPKAPPPGA
jgi:parvulin-like peptidyl-prolyl isomerase